MSWLMKNSKGKDDGAFTAAMLSAIVVLLRVLVGGIHLTTTIKGHSVDLTFTPIEASLATGVLATLWGTYWARKHTDAGGFGAKNPPKEDSPPK